ncbi:hypothetical protein KHQ81_15760 (plasmid) [Mycoplasmatota bacterium]|nr:hypothetical protein KHQ81_15760 [Mycoplasmatota bacterium]
MSLSESTKSILNEIRDTEDGFQAEVKTTPREINLFQKEMDPKYIHDIEKISKNVYDICLGTDWPISVKLIELKENYPEFSIKLSNNYSLDKTDSLFHSGVICQIKYNALFVNVEPEGVIELNAVDIEEKEFLAFKDTNNTGKLNTILQEMEITNDEELKEFLELKRVNVKNFNYFSFNLYEKAPNGEFKQLGKLYEFEKRNFNFVEKIDEIIKDFQKITQKSIQANLDL